jgi:hypothetical protein
MIQIVGWTLVDDSHGYGWACVDTFESTTFNSAHDLQLTMRAKIHISQPLVLSPRLPRHYPRNPLKQGMFAGMKTNLESQVASNVGTFDRQENIVRSRGNNKSRTAQLYPAFLPCPCNTCKLQIDYR